MNERFGDDRRTEIVKTGLGKLSSLDTIPNTPMIVALTKQNYIKRLEPTSFRSQKRGGKGIIGAKTKDEDEIIELVFARNHDYVLYFTNQGRVFKLAVHEIPIASKTARGTAIVNILSLKPDEKVTAMMVADDSPKADDFLIMTTIHGKVKKTALKDFTNVRKNGMIAIRLIDGDELNWVREVRFKDQVMMVTRNGLGIRFEQTEVRPMGRASQGVRGIRLKGSDVVVDMSIVSDESSDNLLVIMENGMGKTTKANEYRLQSRGGSGVKTANITSKTGKLVSGKVLNPEDEADIIIISKKGQTIRISIDEIPSQGRATQGVYLMRMPSDDVVASVSIIPHLTKELAAGMKQIKAEVAEIIEKQKKAKKAKA